MSYSSWWYEDSGVIYTSVADWDWGGSVWTLAIHSVFICHLNVDLGVYCVWAKCSHYPTLISGL